MRRSLMGTEILGIRQTGDLEGRDAKRVFEIYRSLTKGASLLPPAIAFILDEECRDEEAKRELSSSPWRNPFFLSDGSDNGDSGSFEMDEAAEAKNKGLCYRCTSGSA